MAGGRRLEMGDGREKIGKKMPGSSIVVGDDRRGDGRLGREKSAQCRMLNDKYRRISPYNTPTSNHQPSTNNEQLSTVNQQPPRAVILSAAKDLSAHQGSEKSALVGY
jgi:hypothetical protein